MCAYKIETKDIGGRYEIGTMFKISFCLNSFHFFKATSENGRKFLQFTICRKELAQFFR
jgi:hypothetical protein